MIIPLLAFKNICIISSQRMAGDFKDYEQVVRLLDTACRVDVNSQHITLTQKTGLSFRKGLLRVEYITFCRRMQPSQMLKHAVRVLGEDLIKQTDCDNPVIVTYLSKRCLFICVMTFVELVQYLRGYLTDDCLQIKVFRRGRG